MWTEVPPGGKKGAAIPRDRVVSKMFLRGAGEPCRESARPHASYAPSFFSQATRS
jgi:hypothetical protein